MRLYNSLKQSENYNLIIGAMFLSSTALWIVPCVSFVIKVALVVFNFYDATLGDEVRIPWIPITVGIVASVCIVLSCNKAPKLILPVALILFILGIMGLGYFSVGSHLAIMGICWYILIKKDNTDIIKFSKRIIIALIIYGVIKAVALIWFMLIHSEPPDLIYEATNTLSAMIVNPEFFLAWLLYKETNSRNVHRGFVKDILIVWGITILSCAYQNAQSMVEANETREWEENNLKPSNSVELEEGSWECWETEQ